MKKLFASLLIAGAMFTFVNLSVNTQKISAKVKPNIGDYSDKDDFCPNKGDGCVHLDPVVIK